MTQISINLSAEDINKSVAEAIVASTLGDSIKKMVDEYVKTIHTGYNNPIKKIVEEVAREYIIQLLDEHRPTIKDEVRKQITNDVADRLITVSIEKFLKSIYV